MVGYKCLSASGKACSSTGIWTPSCSEFEPLGAVSGCGGYASHPPPINRKPTRLSRLFLFSQRRLSFATLLALHLEHLGGVALAHFDDRVRAPVDPVAAIPKHRAVFHGSGRDEVSVLYDRRNLSD